MRNRERALLVSIIMPAYNSEKYVAEAIESVIHQTYGNWELLAVDDGSTDTTGAIIDAYVSKDSRIRSFHTENKGVSHARNVGLDAAEGEWIAFLDSDDLFSASALMHLIEHSEGCDMVIGNYESFPEEYRLYTIAEEIPPIEYKRLVKELRELEVFFSFYVVWGKLIKRSLIEELFCEKYQLGEDTLFMAKLAKRCGTIQLIVDTLYRYRTENKDSLSHQYRLADLSYREIVKDIYLNIFEDSPQIKSFLYTWHLFTTIQDTKEIVNDPNLNEADKRRSIKSLLDATHLAKVPLMNHYLSPENQRKAALLQIGDIDMIMSEFTK